MLLDAILTVFGIVVCAIFCRGLYLAEVAHSARRQAYYDGTHDYYGNKIEKSAMSFLFLYTPIY